MATNVMERLWAKAKTDPQRVVFPEATEEKILHAARQMLDMGLGKPMLVGDPMVISNLAGSIGVSLDGITVVDSTDEAKGDRLVEEYGKVSQDLPPKAVKRMLRDPMNYGAMMVKLGEADCLVAGLSHTTGEVIMASQMIIGMQEGISTVSSTGILAIPGYEGPKAASWVLPTVPFALLPVRRNWPTSQSPRRTPCVAFSAGSPGLPCSLSLPKGAQATSGWTPC